MNTKQVSLPAHGLLSSWRRFVKNLWAGWKRCVVARVTRKVHATVVALILFSAACSIAQPENNSNASNKQIVLNAFEKWQQGTASIFSILDEQVVWEVSGRSPVSGVYKGKADFMRRAVDPITSTFKTPLKAELISLTADDSFVWLHFKARATTKTDSIYENAYLWKLEIVNGKIIKGTAFLDTYELNHLMTNKHTAMNNTMEETRGYIGMWVTKDGHIRHELLPNNRYDEGRGNRKSAYRGSYKVTGNHIDYKDDTGFTADGEFKDGILYHAGMVLYKEEKGSE